MQNANETTAVTLNEAQLYWDRQDPSNSGWWLRYRDERGVETGCAIDGDEDASTQDLADEIANELPLDSGTIRVFRGDEERGSITIASGTVAAWRA